MPTSAIASKLRDGSMTSAASNQQVELRGVQIQPLREG
jgi:hypothetical protein